MDRKKKNFLVSFLRFIFWFAIWLLIVGVSPFLFIRLSGGWLSQEFTLVGASLILLFLMVGGYKLLPSIEYQEKKNVKKELPKLEVICIISIFIVLALFSFLIIEMWLQPVDIMVPTQCTFPAGLVCVSYKLSTETGKLTLELGQRLGKTIRVTGIECNRNTSTDYTTTAYIHYDPATNITMASENKAFVANASGSGGIANIVCTDANGNPIPDTSIGRKYNGRIYINYTETDTNITKIAIGIITANYEV